MRTRAPRRRAAGQADHRGSRRAVRPLGAGPAPAVLRRRRRAVSAGAIPAARPQAGARAAALRRRAGQASSSSAPSPVLGASGGLGPKLREGDRQVPEGVYSIVYLNPNSVAHLSLALGYPNAFDRAHADGRRSRERDPRRRHHDPRRLRVRSAAWRSATRRRRSCSSSRPTRDWSTPSSWSARSISAAPRCPPTIVRRRPGWTSSTPGCAPSSDALPPAPPPAR